MSGACSVRKRSTCGRRRRTEFMFQLAIVTMPEGLGGRRRRGKARFGGAQQRKTPTAGALRRGFILSVRHAVTSRRICEARATGGKPASAGLVKANYGQPPFCAMNALCVLSHRRGKLRVNRSSWATGRAPRIAELERAVVDSDA